MSDDADEEIALFNLRAAEGVSLPIARAKILHAHAMIAVEAFDGLDHRGAVLSEITRGGAEKDLFERHEGFPRWFGRDVSPERLYKRNLPLNHTDSFYALQCDSVLICSFCTA